MPSGLSARRACFAADVAIAMSWKQSRKQITSKELSSAKESPGRVAKLTFVRP